MAADYVALVESAFAFTDVKPVERFGEPGPERPYAAPWRKVMIIGGIGCAIEAVLLDRWINFGADTTSESLLVSQLG